MKDFIFSNYLRGFGFTYYEFTSNLARLRLSFPLITAPIEKHAIRNCKNSDFLTNNGRKRRKNRRKRRERESFLSFYVSIDFLIN